MCRLGGFAPSAGVLVTTVRATKSHGGVPFDELGTEDLEAVKRGVENLQQHIAIVKAYGVPCVVAVNNFPSDTEAEVELMRELAVGAGAETVVEPRVRRGRRRRGRARGGRGRGLRAPERFPPAHAGRHFDPRPGRGDRDEGVRGGRRRLPARRREGSRADGPARVRHDAGLHGQDAPVAQPRPHAAEPADRVAPSGPRLVPSAGAGFVVVLCGDMQRMPGLGRTPAYKSIDVDEQGRTVGLF